MTDKYSVYVVTATWLWSFADDEVRSMEVVAVDELEARMKAQPEIDRYSKELDWQPSLVAVERKRSES